MKKSFLVLVLMALSLSGCLKSTVMSPFSDTAKGSVSLRLNKTNVPQGVSVVNAVLSRSGHDTLKASLDLVSDTSASITVDSITVGQWHLTVSALDENGNLLYSGQTDVTVVGGVTTQVTLTLVPVGQGTGSIYIIVNWGTTMPNFVDYASNPVFTVSQNPSSPVGVAFPKILLDNGTYKMWYLSTYSDLKPEVWYAQSSDGISWSSSVTRPVLSTSDTAAWDFGGTIGGGQVMKDGNVYRFYYNVVMTSGQVEVGLANSTDGITWQKLQTPVLFPDGSSQYHIGVQSALLVNGTYYLYYDAYPIGNSSAWTINVATSSDGVSWTKCPGTLYLLRMHHGKGAAFSTRRSSTITINL